MWKGMWQDNSILEVKKELFFCSFQYFDYICSHNKKEYILTAIKEKIAELMPSSGVRVILFGSQARGDSNEASDWDLIVFLDKDKLEETDHDIYSYPLFELGWEIDAQIHPLLYTFKDWQSRSFSPFYKNVEREGMTLC